MISVNHVRNGVIKALKQNFPDYKIYGEEIKQGLKEPCFFVKLFPVGHQRELVGRYKRFHSFDIHYFPESKEGINEEAHNIAEQLYKSLEYITVNDGLCRGSKMKHEIIDGVLHFFVDYDFHVISERAVGTKMNTLKQEGKLINGQ